MSIQERKVTGIVQSEYQEFGQMGREKARKAPWKTHPGRDKGCNAKALGMPGRAQNTPGMRTHRCLVPLGRQRPGARAVG